MVPSSHLDWRWLHSLKEIRWWCSLVGDYHHNLIIFQEDRLDPMIYIFPRMTKCTFHKFGTSGEVEKHDALCILPLNIGKANNIRNRKTDYLSVLVVKIVITTGSRISGQFLKVKGMTEKISVGKGRSPALSNRLAILFLVLMTKPLFWKDYK